METTFVIKESDLNDNFISAIKKLFNKRGTLQITITDNEDFGLYKTETAEEFINRVNSRIQDLNKNVNTVSFSPASFDDFVKDHL